MDLLLIVAIMFMESYLTPMEFEGTRERAAIKELYQGQLLFHYLPPTW